MGVKSSADHQLVGQFNDADSIVNCRAKAIETLDFKTFTFDVAIPELFPNYQIELRGVAATLCVAESEKLKAQAPFRMRRRWVFR